MQQLCKKKKIRLDPDLLTPAVFHDILHYLEFITGLVISTKIEKSTCDLIMSK